MFYFQKYGIGIKMQTLTNIFIGNKKGDNFFELSPRATETLCSLSILCRNSWLAPQKKMRVFFLVPLSFHGLVWAYRTWNKRGRIVWKAPIVRLNGPFGNKEMQEFSGMWLMLRLWIVPSSSWQHLAVIVQWNFWSSISYE